MFLFLESYLLKILPPWFPIHFSMREGNGPPPLGISSGRGGDAMWFPYDKRIRQAGAEQCQAQHNLTLDLQGDHFELSQKLKKITFKEKRICQAAIVHIVDVFSPFDNNTPISLNAS